MTSAKIILLSFFVSAVTSILTVFCLTSLMSPHARVEKEAVVPLLTGLRVDQARKLLASRELLLNITDRREHPTLAKDLITDQKPIEGSKVKARSEVSVMISSGPLKKQPIGKQLMVETDRAFSPGADNIQQKEAWEKEIRHKEAQLKKGEPKGIQPDETQDDLTQRKKIVQQKFIESHSKSQNHTISAASQSARLKKAGHRLANPNSKSVKVPNLVYRTLERARKLLHAAKLKIGSITYYADEDHRDGIVLRQSPPAGTPLPRDRAVDLVVNATD